MRSGVPSLIMCIVYLFLSYFSIYIFNDYVPVIIFLIGGIFTAVVGISYTLKYNERRYETK